MVSLGSVGIVAGASIFILFVTLGGLLAAVWTDIFLFVLMWAGPHVEAV
jgi:Na+/proline symporter